VALDVADEVFATDAALDDQHNLGEVVGLSPSYWVDVLATGRKGPEDGSSDSSEATVGDVEVSRCTWFMSNRDIVGLTISRSHCSYCGMYRLFLNLTVQIVELRTLCRS